VISAREYFQLTVAVIIVVFAIFANWLPEILAVPGGLKREEDPIETDGHRNQEYGE
jgi:hypothetical protein